MSGDEGIKIPKELNAKLDALTGRDKNTKGWEQREAAINWKADLAVGHAGCSSKKPDLSPAEQERIILKTFEDIAANPQKFPELVAQYSDPKKRKLEEVKIGIEIRRDANGDLAGFSCSNVKTNSAPTQTPRDTSPPSTGIRI